MPCCFGPSRSASPTASSPCGSRIRTGSRSRCWLACGTASSCRSRSIANGASGSAPSTKSRSGHDADACRRRRSPGTRGHRARQRLDARRPRRNAVHRQILRVRGGRGRRRARDRHQLRELGSAVRPRPERPRPIGAVRGRHVHPHRRPPARPLSRARRADGALLGARRPGFRPGSTAAQSQLPGAGQAPARNHRGGGDSGSRAACSTADRIRFGGTVFGSSSGTRI